MQDEILKHSNKIFKTLTTKNHSFKEKFKEIVIEICIIVFAVSFSIWLHSLSEHSHQQEEVKVFYNALKNDLEKDIKILTEEKNNLVESKKGIQKILKLSKKQMDSIGRLEIDFYLTTRRTNDANYEGFKSSGKIGYIENIELKSKILSYYQSDMQPLNDIEKYLNSQKIELMELVGAKSFQATAFAEPLINTKTLICKGGMTSLIKSYEENIKTANGIIKSINEENKK